MSKESQSSEVATRESHANRTVRLLVESLVLLATGFALMHFLESSAGPGGVVGLSGHDSFYHVRMSLLQAERGVLHQFPWLKFVFFTNEGHDFVSHHFGFHVILWPFVKAGEIFYGDAMVGGRLETQFFCGLNLMLFNLLLAMQGVRHRWLWVAMYAFMPYQFLTRHAYVRAIGPSMAVVQLLLMAMFARRDWLAGICVAAYVLLYLGGVVFAPLVVVGFVAASVLAPREQRVWPFRLVAWTVGGWVAGILLYPYSSAIFEFLQLQIFGSGLAADIKVGGEWSSYNAWFLGQMSGPMLVTFAAALIIRLRSGRVVDHRTVALLLLSFAMFTLMLKAKRFVEYWPLIHLLACAYLAAPMVDGAIATWRANLIRSKDRTAAMWTGAMMFAAGAILTVCLAIWPFGAMRRDPSLKGCWWMALLPLAMMLVYVLFDGWLAGRHISPQDDQPDHNARTAAPARTAWTVFVLTCGLLICSILAAPLLPLWKATRDSLTCYYDIPAIREMMAFLQDDSRPGDVIFTDDWDVFPVYFFHNTRDYYIVGLDPKFTHQREPIIWERYVKISRGQVPTTITVDDHREIDPETNKPVKKKVRVRLADIRDVFGCRYVICDRDHRPLAAKLHGDRDLAELVFPSTRWADAHNAPYVVFRIKE